MMDKMVDVADTMHRTRVSFVIPTPLAPPLIRGIEGVGFSTCNASQHGFLAQSHRRGAEMTDVGFQFTIVHFQFSIINYQLSIFPKTVYWFPVGFGRYHCLFCVRHTDAG